MIAESVNPLAATRDAWRDVAARAGRPCLEVEPVCSDAAEHERRVTTRTSDVPGLRKPDWSAVLDREYESWDRDHLVVNTSGRAVADCVDELLRALAAPGLGGAAR